MLEEKEAMPARSLSLFYRGRQLAPQTTVSEADIHQGDTLRAHLRLRGGMLQGTESKSEDQKENKQEAKYFHRTEISVALRGQTKMVLDSLRTEFRAPQEIKYKAPRFWVALTGLGATFQCQRVDNTW